MKEVARRLGRHGGNTTLKRHGKTHFSEAAKTRWNKTPEKIAEKERQQAEEIRKKKKRRRILIARKAGKAKWRKAKRLGELSHKHGGDACLKKTRAKQKNDSQHPTRDTVQAGLSEDTGSRAGVI